MKEDIIIALGSSLGDGISTFESAQSWLESKGVKIVKSSKNYTFPPFGGMAQNDFTNAVWIIDDTAYQRSFKNLSLRRRARKLLRLLQACEKAHGRTRDIKWGDRTLDLDILYYKNLRVKTKSLTIPHPEMATRDFVQIPLKEVFQSES